MWRLKALLLAGLLLAGCADMQEGWDKVKSYKLPSSGSGGAGLDNPMAHDPRPYPPIRDTELHQIFANKPFASFPYPRVVIRLIEPEKIPTRVTPASTARQTFLQPDIKGCWSFDAIIWFDEVKKKKIQPFSYCEPEDNRSNQNSPPFDFMRWPITSGLRTNPNTGDVYTDGPTPPNHSIPSSPYKKFYTDSNVGLNAFYNFVIDMMFDYSVSDSRVWFVIPDKLDK